MTIQIDIENSQVEYRPKKNGGQYALQEGYAHTVNKDGTKKRYPERVNIFPQKDEAGNYIPYAAGKYIVSASSLRVNNGYLVLGFPVLVPLK
jgi:hypothetical protein